MRSERTDVLVVCNDDSLLIELGPLLGDRYRVHAVDTLTDLGGQVCVGAQIQIARWIGVVDVDSLTGARAALARLGLQHPGCPLIVITGRPGEWAASVARGAVLAAIGRDQITTARLNEALLAAGRRLRTDGLEAADPTGPGAGPDRAEGGPRRRGVRWVVGTAALLTVGLVVVGLVLPGVTGQWLPHRAALHDRHAVVAPAGANRAAESAPRGPGSIATTSEAAGPMAAQLPNVLELLSAARVAFREQRWLPPRAERGVQAEGGMRGDSALELYVQVLRQDPQNDEALAGVKRLLIVGRDRITADAASGEIEDANRLLALFRAAGVSARDLQPLAEVTAGAADALAARTLRAQEVAKKLKLQLTAMAAQVNRAIRAGALLPPAADNALAHLAAMRSIGRSHPLTLQAQDVVQTALVQAGEQATGAAQFALAHRDLNAAAELGSFAPLAYARRQLQVAEAASERRPAVAAATVRQADASAARAPAWVGGAFATAALTASPPSRPYIAAQPTRALPLRYPDEATGTGSVIVEFTLASNGSASDLTVVQSDLPAVFDRAALRAVRHGRYSTRGLVDGKPVRARIRLRFNTD